MIKKVVLLISFLPFLNTAQEQPPLKPWVKKSEAVYVRMLSTYWQIYIDDKTSIADLKKKIQNSDGLRAEYQAINPFWRKWYFLWILEGPIQDNHRNVKQIMNEYGTNCFEVRNTKQQQEIKK